MDPSQDQPTIPTPAETAPDAAPRFADGAAVTARVSDDDASAVAAVVVSAAAPAYDPALPAYLTDQFATVLVRTADGSSVGVPADYITGTEE
jgi:hypothetical protein